ncbi:response regulator [Pelovirga terrestris]|uniref:Response regulator n=1 Tax=Pelovirga terrestris TaxID=2771352 RepID=A0A8J6R0D2_9BACT|nr:response regulator [Pelovirga terrestris]MBD1401877.1 response regulator [Pelovirga terrestris]
MGNDAVNVLLIDDSPTVRRLGELILSQNGYQVYTAEDGEAGLELARQVSPAVILVDYIMPKMDGHVFCQKVQEDDKLRDIPIILISSKGESVGKTFEQKYGVLHYFSKPFEPEELIDKLNEVLGSDTTDDPAEEPLQPPGPDSTMDSAPLIEMVDRLFQQYLKKDIPLLIRGTMNDILCESGLVKTGSLVFSGNLTEVPLADVVNFIYNSRLSGRLTVFYPGMFGEVYIENGQLVFAICNNKWSKQPFLTDILRKQKVLEIEGSAISETIVEARERHIPIGRILVEKKLITETQLMEALQIHAQEAFSTILEAKEGNFYLERDPLPFHLRDITTRVPLINVLMEGLRHMDERRLAATEFQDESMVLVRLISNEDAFDTINLKRQELEIFALIDGKKSLAEIVAESHLDRLETKRICYALRRVGLLRIKGG